LRLERGAERESTKDTKSTKTKEVLGVADSPVPRAVRSSQLLLFVDFLSVESVDGS
jgi:hypothetical protein